MSSTLLDLALVVSLAAVIGIILRMFRQPIILAYLATGLIVGAVGYFNIANHEAFGILADLGVMLLLFTIGLEINYTSLRLVGKQALILGLGQVGVTFFIGYALARVFNFDPSAAAYIAIALTFSSTIIVVKLLSEKRETNSLYGKLSMGFLLVQDMVAILLLLVLTGIEHGEGFAFLPLAWAVAKGIVVLAIMLWLGRTIFPPLFRRVARSQELLFITSLGWVFVVAAVMSKLGFNVEIAGFLAGIALANSSESFSIASHIRPLRDFFILVFFVVLGSSITLFNLGGLGWPVIVFSLFVLIGNPLIVLVLMGAMGYRRRTSFMAGVTMAQISEFSLILAALGLKLGHITNREVGLITAVGIISIIASTYLIMHGDVIVKKFWHLLAIFERLNPLNEPTDFDGEFRKPIVLIGASRTGDIIASHLPKDDLLIIDTDPEVIHRLKKRGYHALLGDIDDRDIFESAHMETVQLVISTSPLLSDNMTLLSELRDISGKRHVIVRAENDHDATTLYEKGADYVIRPHLTSGHYIGEILKDVLNDGLHSKRLQEVRDLDLKITRKESL